MMRAKEIKRKVEGCKKCSAITIVTNEYNLSRSFGVPLFKIMVDNKLIATC